MDNLNDLVALSLSKKGNWFDFMDKAPQGSGHHEFSRAPPTKHTSAQIKAELENALSWLVRDGQCEQIEIEEVQEKEEIKFKVKLWQNKQSAKYTQGSPRILTYPI